MKKTVFTCAFGASLALTLAVSTQANAAEKSLWQKFVSFFDPSPTVEGVGPEYDKLRALDKEIDKTEGRYSRERRPGNKDRLKKQLEELHQQRDQLAEEIEKKENSGELNPAGNPAASSSSVAQPTPQSSATQVSSDSNKQAIACARDTIIVHDTISVHDTVTVHDTLYVIVANPAQASPAQAAPAQANSAPAAPAQADSASAAK